MASLEHVSSILLDVRAHALDLTRRDDDTQLAEVVRHEIPTHPVQCVLVDAVTRRAIQRLERGQIARIRGRVAHEITIDRTGGRKRPAWDGLVHAEGRFVRMVQTGIVTQLVRERHGLLVLGGPAYVGDDDYLATGRERAHATGVAESGHIE